MNLNLLKIMTELRKYQIDNFKLLYIYIYGDNKFRNTKPNS